MTVPGNITYALSMARWEPNAKERLVRAALDLFTEQGYDATTVAEIADRAGLTKTTFFRHFADKKEVLFAGQAVHTTLLAEAIAEAPVSATPLEAAAAALDALTATFTADRRDIAAKLRPLIAANPELQERAVYKNAKLTESMAAALQARGTPEPTAALAAALAIHAFHLAFGRWADPANPQSLTELTRHALDELKAAAATLT